MFIYITIVRHACLCPRIVKALSECRISLEEKHQELATGKITVEALSGLITEFYKSHKMWMDRGQSRIREDERSHRKAV